MQVEFIRQWETDSTLPLSYKSNFYTYEIKLWSEKRRQPIKIGEISLPRKFDVKKLQEELNANL